MVVVGFWNVTREQREDFITVQGDGLWRIGERAARWVAGATCRRTRNKVGTHSSYISQLTSERVLALSSLRKPMVCSLSSVGREFQEQVAMPTVLFGGVDGEGGDWGGGTRRPVVHGEGGGQHGMPSVLYAANQRGRRGITGTSRASGPVGRSITFISQQLISDALGRKSSSTFASPHYSPGELVWVQQMQPGGHFSVSDMACLIQRASRDMNQPHRQPSGYTRSEPLFARFL